MALFADSFESVTHSFVVKIWLEDGDQTRWRGHITHIPDGERRYVEELADVIDFIAPYVEGMKVGNLRLVRKWLSARRRIRKKDPGENR